MHKMPIINNTFFIYISFILGLIKSTYAKRYFSQLNDFFFISFSITIPSVVAKKIVIRNSNADKSKPILPTITIDSFTN